LVATYPNKFSNPLIPMACRWRGPAGRGEQAANLAGMNVHKLSRRDARRIAVRAQLLDLPRPKALLEVVHQLTLLQADATAAVAPNAHLVAWSRIGSGYSTAELEDALAGRALVELNGMIRPAEDLVMYRAEMEERRRGERGWPQTRAWILDNDAARRDILDRLGSSGPLRAKDIPDTCAVPWQSSGWNNDRNVILLLECMMRRGEVAVAGRQGRDRLWDLAERIYPDDPAVPAGEALRFRNEWRLRSLGIARSRAPVCPGEPQDVGEAGEQAEVEGVRGSWQVDPSLLGQSFAGRTALLSPLDRLVFDRKRMTELFEFDYQLEMYKPAARRRWGYFALPILHGDRLIGKLDATADRKSGVLRVDAIHEDAPFGEAVTDAVRAEIEDLAQWLELELALPR
jgi:uncharacterized protein YcaQ